MRSIYSQYTQSDQYTLIEQSDNGVNKWWVFKHICDSLQKQVSHSTSHNFSCEIQHAESLLCQICIHYPTDYPQAEVYVAMCLQSHKIGHVDNYYHIASVIFSSAKFWWIWWIVAN